MPREVTHTADGPLKLTPDDIDDEKGDVAVCLCGLSDEYPFCDGSHRKTEDEDPDECYKYVDGERHRVRVEVVDGADREGEGDESGHEAIGSEGA